MAMSMQDDVVLRPAAPEPSDSLWEVEYAAEHFDQPERRLDKRVCLLFWLGVSAVGWALVGLLFGSF